MQRYLRVLRQRAYALLWGGATVSSLGDGMTFVALVWLVLERGGGAAEVGWLGAAYSAPVIIGGLAGGLVLDRFDPRKVLIADNAIRGLVMASVPIAAALGVLTLPHIFLAAATYGLLYMVSGAGMPTILPRLLSGDELITANAMESISWSIGGLVGPVLAGLLIAVIGAPTVLAFDALSYGVFVACLLGMGPLPALVRSAAGRSALGGTPGVEGDAGPAEGGQVGSAPEVGSGPTDSKPAGRGLGPAVRFILGTPAVLAITLIYMTGNIGEGIFTVFAPIYVRDVLLGDAAVYGVVVSAFTGGALLGAVLVGALGWRWPLGRSIAAAVLAAGLVQGLLIFRPSLMPLVLVLAGIGLCSSCLTAWAQTIRMRLIPPELRGRVFAVLRTLMRGTPPLGSLLAGFLLAGGDITWAVLVATVLNVVPGAIGLVHPALSRAATGEAKSAPAPA